ncbi:MAG: hypothetical protein FWH19_03935 [Treponema sp.]|nr:hypothetical protein [Treponema sp.]
MNRPEVALFLKSFFADLKKAGTDLREAAPLLKSFNELILSLKRDLPLSIPLLKELANFKNNSEGIVFHRLERRYYRLCRLQNELSRLDLKKAAPGVSSGTANLEDFVFSQIDFSRYRAIEEKDFKMIFPDGLTDFDEAFFKNNFRLGREEVQNLIKESYEKAEGLHKLKQENPVILSIMRSLETSLEDSPLFTSGEITGELKNLLDFCHAAMPNNTELLYPLLVYGLDDTQISHSDGMTTRLFIPAQGDLSGTFQPAGKPWTRVLIPAALITARPTR